MGWNLILVLTGFYAPAGGQQEIQFYFPSESTCRKVLSTMKVTDDAGRHLIFACRPETPPHPTPSPTK